MDEKRETSSISGLSGEKRDGDGSEEKDELESKRAKLQDLDSDVLAKDVKPCTVVKTSTSLPKASSVSKDDDRLVADSGTHNTVKDVVSKLETQGVHVDPVSKNNSSVLKPREVTESVVSPRDDASVSDPFQMCSGGAPEKSDSMRRWMEMKQNGFLSGPLGGPVEVTKKRRRKKKNQVTNKEQQHVVVVDRFSNVAAPSGLLTDLKPGILRHVRSKEQVCSFLEALIRNADDVRDRALASKLPSTTVSDHAISFTNPEQAVEAATVASQWLEFLHQDLSERLSAVKDSRNRVDATLKAELPLLVSSKESSSNQQSTSTSGDISLDKTVTGTHQMKWSAKFDQFKKDLHDEEIDLESSLNQVKDMQSRCNEGLRQMDEASLGKDGTNQETSLAVQAAAASIFSTCRFLLSKMKPPQPNSS